MKISEIFNEKNNQEVEKPVANIHGMECYLHSSILGEDFMIVSSGAFIFKFKSPNNKYQIYTKKEIQQILNVKDKVSPETLKYIHQFKKTFNGKIEEPGDYFYDMFKYLKWIRTKQTKKG